MTVTETLGALGSWTVELSDNAPDDVVSQLGLFGHIAIIAGPADVAAIGDGLLQGARYVGVCRSRPNRGRTIGGSGMRFWLGDEDDKGHVIEAALTLTNATLAAAVAAILPPTVTVGTVYAQVDPNARYTGTHQFQTPAKVMQIICDHFGVEYRVNGNATVDVGTAAQLYNTTTPDSIIMRRGAASDIDLTAVGGEQAPDENAYDYTTRVVLLGSTTTDGDEKVFSTGAVNAPIVPYKDLRGGTVKLTRLISESDQPQGTAAQRAQLKLNEYNRLTRSLSVTAQEYDYMGTLRVGDGTYIYDPEAGVLDAARQVLFRGQVIYPDLDRITSRTWPVSSGHTVAFRTGAGVWLDLTPYVVWDREGDTDITVGDLPKSLTSPSTAIQDRLDGIRVNAGNTGTPKVPTGLTLATSSITADTGADDTSVITATWNPVTQNDDNTTATLARYEVRYRPTFRAPNWTGDAPTANTLVDLFVVAALSYDVEVRAVGTSGRASAWSATATITTAADGQAPNAPSDPVVTPWTGILRVFWNGRDNVGGPMPPDFNRVEVHVGTTSAFTADHSAASTTRLSSLSSAGIAHVVAPYGSPRYVRLIPFDHTGNMGSPSATVAGTTVKVSDGDVSSLNVGLLTSGLMTADVAMAGRFATALTGARREMNAVGFQAWDALNNLLVNLDGIDNLLTGRFRTALSGRRIEAGASGSMGSVDFIAPDGTTGKVTGFTSSLPAAGVEALALRLPIANTYPGWNSLQIQSNQHAYLLAGSLHVNYGGDASTGSFSVEHATNKGTAAGTPPTLEARLMIDEINGTRFWDDGNRLRMKLSNDGGWTVWDGDDIQNAGDKRIEVANDWTFIYAPSGPNNSFQGQPQIGVYRDKTVIRGHTNTTGDDSYISFIEAGNAGSSVRVSFQNRLDQGGLIKYFNLAGDTGGQRFEFRNNFDTVFLPIWASAFVVNSDRKAKRRIRDLEVDGLATVLELRPRSYTRPMDDMPDLEQHGFATDEMPDSLVVGDPTSGDATGIDVMAVVAAIVDSAQQMHRRLVALEEGAAA